MTSSEKDVAHFKPPESLRAGDLLAPSQELLIGKTHDTADGLLKTSYRPPIVSQSSSLRATTSPPQSRSISPSGRAASAESAGNPPYSRRSANDQPSSSARDVSIDNSRELILRSFVPHVAVHASQDTDDLAKEKGIVGGFKDLLRPFGDLVQGKVVVRDSAGASRGWDNYGIRFVELRGVKRDSTTPNRVVLEPDRILSNGALRSDDKHTDTTSSMGGDISKIEDLVEQYMLMAENERDAQLLTHWHDHHSDSRQPYTTSPFYALYLRRLLSDLPVTPHETFAHPVACIIAISSRNASPIEALRQLYHSTSQENVTLPKWIHNEFLRYYLLVHDEDRDDLVKSTALFDQMKRHFGLHCHMLRLRSNECVLSDDESVRLPHAGWISAAEELAQLRDKSEFDCLLLNTGLIQDRRPRICRRDPIMSL